MQTRSRVQQNTEVLQSNVKTLILTYEEYCSARKGKRALEAGVIFPLAEAISLKIVNDTNTQIFFCRSEFHSNIIQKLYATERGNIFLLKHKSLDLINMTRIPFRKLKKTLNKEFI